MFTNLPDVAVRILHDEQSRRDHLEHEAERRQHARRAPDAQRVLPGASRHTPR